MDYNILERLKGLNYLDNMFYTNVKIGKKRSLQP